MIFGERERERESGVFLELGKVRYKFNWDCKNVVREEKFYI